MVKGNLEVIECLNAEEVLVAEGNNERGDGSGLVYYLYGPRVDRHPDYLTAGGTHTPKVSWSREARNQGFRDRRCLAIRSLGLEANTQ